MKQSRCAFIPRHSTSLIFGLIIAAVFIGSGGSIASNDVGSPVRARSGTPVGLYRDSGQPSDSTPSATAPPRQLAPTLSMTVNRTDDISPRATASTCNGVAGDCTLREAVIKANTISGADSITLPAGTYTLSLTGPDPAEDFAAYGDIDIRESVTINGAGSGSTIIQAGAAAYGGIDKIFGINPDCSGAGASINVTISGVTLQNGHNAGPFNATQFNHTGGAIDYCGGGSGTNSLTLTDVIFKNNQVDQGAGGGLNVSGVGTGTTTIDISDSQFLNNKTIDPNHVSTGAGASIILNTSATVMNVTIDNCTFDGNQATQSSAGGLGVYSNVTAGHTGTLQIHHSQFTNNQAKGAGGGVQIVGTSGANGVISATIDQETVIDSNITGINNGTAFGGGLHADLIHTNSSLAISKTTISNNSESAGATTKLGGGGIFVANAAGSGVTIQYSRIVDNTASAGAGLKKDNQPGSVNAANNWWGCSTGPAATPCDVALLQAGSGSLTTTPFLEMKTAAATNPIKVNQTSVVTSTVADSTGNPTAVSNLDVFIHTNGVAGSPLPVSWSSVGGSVSPLLNNLASVGGFASASTTYTATAANVGNKIAAKVDNDSTVTGSNVASITVNKADTAVSITNAASLTSTATVTGETYTVDYTVSSPQGFTPTAPTNINAVTVSDGVSTCTGSFNLSTGQGSCVLRSTTAGAKTITASFITDSNFNGSTSPGVSHTVNKADTTTTITNAASLAATPSVTGETVEIDWSVTVNPPGSVGVALTGNVTVQAGSDSCTAPVSAGKCSVTFTTTGAKTITATYQGDSNYNGSASAGASHTVNKADTTTAITNAASLASTPSLTGQTVEIDWSVTVNAPGSVGAALSGNVTIQAGADTCSAPVSAGKCNLTFTTCGAKTITASYIGDGNYNGSTSSGASHNVNEPPTITCPGNFNVNADPNLCTAAVTFATTSTGCPTPTITCKDQNNTIVSSGTAFPKGTTMVTCTASNGVLPNATCSFTVTVNDTQPPIITCPSNITRGTDPNLCTSVTTFIVTATDNCGTVTPMCSPPSGSTFPKGSTTVSCAVTDSSNLTSNCSFTVTVNDTQPPSITCPGNITTVADPGVCTAVVLYSVPTAMDNCPGLGLVSCSPSSGSTFPKGTTSVNCSVTDASLNNSTCSFSVTVNDTQAPVITCPPGNGAFATSGATDCQPPQNGAYSGSGATTYGAVSTITNSLVFQLSGCTPPPLTGSVTGTFTGIFKGDYSTGGPVSKVQAPASASVKYTFASAVGGTRMFNTELLSLNVSGGNFPASTILRESPTLQSLGQTRIDTIAGGFRITSFFDVFTELSTDGGATWTPSTGSSHIELVQSTDPNLCTAVVNYPLATAAENCSGVGAVTCLPASGTVFAKGTTTVTCSVTDGATPPITSTCSFTVTIVDGQLPAISCPANITMNESSPGAGSAIVTYTTPTPTDNCTPAPTASCVPASGSSFAVGTTTVTCTATDSSLSTNACTFSITVNPLCSLSCPGNIATNTDPNLCTAAVTYSPPVVTGSCGTVTCAPPSGSTFSKGVTTVTCTASVGAPLVTCSFTVTVNDTQPPVLVGCPANIVKSTDPNLCTAVTIFTSPTATDNCPGVGAPVCVPASGTTFPKGVTTVTCTVSDAASPANITNCSFTVTVNDTQAPAMICPSNIVKSTDPNQCSAVTTYATPAATDNCPGLGAVTCSPAAGTSFPKGVTTVTCSVSDATTPPNTTTCSFTVTVNDSQSPSITCPANIVKSTDPGACSAVTTFTVTASDNCPGVTVVSSPASGTAFPKGTTTVTATATDTSGNTTQCTFTVTVNDTQPPAIVCPANATASTAPNQCSAVINYTVTATDNCPGVSIVASPPSGSTFPKGTTTVMATATDGSGNTSHCTFTVTVVDLQPPAIVCPANVTTSAGNPGAGGVVVTYPAPTFSDNCPGVTASCVPASGSMFPIGITTVTCTARDLSGNTSTCAFTVTTFDVCIQDDSSGAVLLWNSATGDYMFCCEGSVYTGRGTSVVKGNVYNLTDSTGTKRVKGTADKSVNKGTGSLQSPVGVQKCSITDRDIRNNTCACNAP
jgi:hypothetical protein